MAVVLEKRALSGATYAVAMTTTSAPIDLDHLRTWIGHEQADRDVAAVRHARLMAATVDRPGPALQAGDALPPLWHWLYFLEARPPGELGPDGHPARGGFLPPVPLSNRMWAGGRVVFEAPIPLGATMDKRSRVRDVRHRRGRSGDLVFVTVLHEVHVDGRRCVREEHDIVYKAPTPPAASAGPGSDAATLPGERVGEAIVTPDATMLFRYSALTFNGHRIHYDLDHCRRVEGYDNLVIHGPLVATLLCGLAQQVAGRPVRTFDYRGLRPALLGATLTLQAHRDGAAADGRLVLRSVLPDGGVSMQAEVGLA
jgi:3-methylfumaryl-CoA hydratase